jgi:hypothetical protein
MSLVAAQAASPLERRYAALLLAYPAPYRQARGSEILGTLLDTARPGQRWPHPVEAADIVLSGLRQRGRIDQVPGLAAGIRTAAPIALAFAAGLSAFLLVAFELDREEFTLGAGVYPVWIVAVVAWSFGSDRLRRAPIAVAVAGTLAAVPVSAINLIGRPPLWTTAVLTVLGLLALAGSGRPNPRTAWAVPAVALAFAGTALAWHTLVPDTGLDWWYGYYDRAVVASGFAAATLVAAVAGVALVQALRRRPARHWLWAALLLALPGGCLGPVSPTSLFPSHGLFYIHYGRLANLLLSSCTLAAIMVWLGGSGSGSRVRRALANTGLVRTTGLVIGCGAALATLRMALDGSGDQLPLAALCWLAAAIGWVALPPNNGGATASSALVFLALLASASSLGFDLNTGSPAEFALVLVLLAAVALCGSVASAPDRAREGGVVLASGVTTLAVAGSVAFYGAGYRLDSMSTFTSDTLLGALVLVPLAAVAVAGVTALRRPALSRPLRRAATWAMVGTSTAWIAVVSLPYLSSFGPVLSLTIGTATVAGTAHALVARRRAHDPALEQAYREYATGAHRRLLAIGYLLTGDDRAAEWLATEALARVYPVWRRLPEPAAADALARRALVRAAARVRTGDAADDLWSRLHALPYRERAALVLSLDETLTPEDVADALGCSVATVDRLTAKAYAATRRSG